SQEHLRPSLRRRSSGHHNHIHLWMKASGWMKFGRQRRVGIVQVAGRSMETRGVHQDLRLGQSEVQPKMKGLLGRVESRPAISKLAHQLTEPGARRIGSAHQEALPAMLRHHRAEGVDGGSSGGLNYWP